MEWTTTKDRPPPEGEAVEAKFEDGRVMRIMRRGRAYATADELLRLYVIPTHWRPLVATTAKQLDNI